MKPKDVFIELILGLALYHEERDKWRSRYPSGLVHAMNAIALEKGTEFPKTFTAFLAQCRQPLEAWYSLAIDGFSKLFAVLDDNGLTEPASDFLFGLPSDLVEQQRRYGFVPVSVLDNFEMLQFLNNMREMEDKAEAQHTYAVIRSFLIEHSWIERRTLKQLRQEKMSEETINWVKDTFYEEDNSGEDVYFCDYCGVLRVVDGRLVGIKPSYCDDHMESPHVQKTEVNAYSRLRIGIHQRTFLPGRAEFAIFNGADKLHDEFPDHLTDVVRYPGLDTYDLRLVFRDEVWAVDVKDIADPEDMSKKTLPIDKADGITHDKGFYVVPDRRFRFIPDYMQQVRRAKPIKPPLYLCSQEEFCDKMRTKCTDLVKASR